MDVLTTGYPSLDYIVHVSHHPTVGETALLRNLLGTPYFGGCGANVAVGLTRLGFKSGVAMVVGDDTAGDNYCQYLSQLQVNTDNVTQVTGQQTSRSYLFLGPENQYQNFFYPGAADAWQSTLTLHGIERYRFAVVTVGYLAYNEQFVQAVTDVGIPLIWELKPDIHAYPSTVLKTFWEASSYVLMNHIEADYVLSAMRYPSVDDLLHESMQAVIVTNGAAGADIYTPTGRQHVPAIYLAHVADTTGAGDAFTAGFLAGLLRDAPPVVSAQLGVVVASFVIGAVGSQTNLPSWEQAIERYTHYFGQFLSS